MIELPATEGVPVLRIDFTDDASWDRVRQALLAPDEDSGYEPDLECVDRRDLIGFDPGELDRQMPRQFPNSGGHPFVVIVDAVTFGSPDHPVLLIDLHEDQPGPSFRALPSTVANIEANLAEANVDFAEFADGVGEDGIYRGFE